MSIQSPSRLEPVKSINLINSFRQNSQEYSGDQTDNPKDQASKERQLHNQIYMENSVLTDVGQHINMYA